MARKVIEKPQHLCWDCAYSKPYNDERYISFDGGPIFYHCYLDPNNIKRGLMNNTKSCSQFKERRTV